MDVAIIGGGRVGLPVAAVFAEKNNRVVCCEKNPGKLSMAQSGAASFREPNLDVMLRKHVRSGALTFVADMQEAVKKADVCFITLATHNDNHDNLRNVVEEAASLMPAGGIIAIKSTVLPTTSDSLATKIGNHVSIAVNPEFLREGKAIADFSNPDRIIVGAKEKAVFHKLRKLYAPWINKGIKWIETTRAEAEIIKISANYFLSARVAMINEISDLCESIDSVNINSVRAGLIADRRIGKEYITPSIGFGGSCLPKDCQLLEEAGQLANLPMNIVKAIIFSNEKRSQYLAQKIKEKFSHITHPTITIWGLTFKPDSDDIRDSVALNLLEQLRNTTDSWKFCLYDPNFQGKSIHGHHVFNDWKSSLKQADGLVVLLAHSIFRQIGYENVKSAVNGNPILDLAHIWNINSS